MRCFEAEAFSGAVVDTAHREIDVFSGDQIEAHFLRVGLPDEAIHILVGPALPGGEEFVTWLDELKDKRAQVRIAARLHQAESGSLGDWQPIEGEVSEMRVHYGPGYGLYFVRRGRTIVVSSQKGNLSNTGRVTFGHVVGIVGNQCIADTTGDGPRELPRRIVPV